MTYTLIKLSVTSPGHGWVVTTIDLSNVITLDVGYLVHGQVAGKWYLKEGGSRITTPQCNNVLLLS